VLRTRRWAILVAIGVGACTTPTAPPLPVGAVAYAPDPNLVAIWWSQVEGCSGLRGDVNAIRWYIVPDAGTFEWDHSEAIGLYQEHGNRIVLASAYAFRDRNVRHEMLHALIKLPGHPPEYFKVKCAGLVD
jgi:hypothetical protein